MLELTSEEKNYVLALANENQSKSMRLLHHASSIVPCVMFAAYGIYNRDVLMLTIAFLALLLVKAIAIFYEFSYLDVSQSVFKKFAQALK